MCVNSSSLVGDNISAEAPTEARSVGSKVQLKSGTAKLLKESDWS